MLNLSVIHFDHLHGFMHRKEKEVERQGEEWLWYALSSGNCFTVYNPDVMMAAKQTPFYICLNISKSWIALRWNSYRIGFKRTNKQKKNRQEICSDAVKLHHSLFFFLEDTTDWMWLNWFQLNNDWIWTLDYSRCTVHYVIVNGGLAASKGNRELVDAPPLPRRNCPVHLRAVYNDIFDLGIPLFYAWLNFSVFYCLLFLNCFLCLIDSCSHSLTCRSGTIANTSWWCYWLHTTWKSPMQKNKTKQKTKQSKINERVILFLLSPRLTFQTIIGCGWTWQIISHIW